MSPVCDRRRCCCSELLPQPRPRAAHALRIQTGLKEPLEKLWECSGNAAATSSDPDSPKCCPQHHGFGTSQGYTPVESPALRESPFAEPVPAFLFFWYALFPRNPLYLAWSLETGKEAETSLAPAGSGWGGAEFLHPMAQGTEGTQHQRDQKWPLQVLCPSAVLFKRQVPLG